VSAQGEEVEMRNLFKRRPSPSLLVAIAVLVAALTGGAIAGVATVSVLSKSEKIADQKIDQRAPDLAVKFAATAGDVSNQMWAIVNADGTLFRATPGITSSARDSDGKYLVSTNRAVSGCSS
jgi:hypothetical protein